MIFDVGQSFFMTNIGIIDHCRASILSWSAAESNRYWRLKGSNKPRSETSMYQLEEAGRWEVERASATFGQVITACNNCVPAPPLEIYQHCLMECGRKHALPMGEKQQRIREEHAATRRSREDGQRASVGFGAGY
jgi:hypothetical protein